MAKKSATSKKPRKKPAIVTKKVRRLRLPNYHSFKLTPRIKNDHPKLPPAWRLFVRTFNTLKQNWKLFLSISLMYGLLTIVLVHGLSSQTNIHSLKENLKGVFNGKYSGLSTSAILFTYVIGAGSSSSSEAGGVYQIILLVIFSLVSIWALRQVLADAKVKLRDSLYKSTYPLIPFLLVLFIIGLQLIPLLVGSWLYGTITLNAIAVTALEKVVWALLCLMLATLSLYMICSSLFALYIVTLPDMTPMKALRSARQLVRHRRWEVLRKILFLPLALLIIGGLIFIPMVSVAPGAVEWIFLVLSIFILVIIHGYMYTLYRELL